ncbi:hypothetical protein like AT3G05130 [Hibiscus trionum]|uniref:Uncharacterized protein n=1 Tax=Hibiscus trionum TaxID=183268 RepID=A0A9W7LIB8_HIBTR|nr:hypothetical protein like AT3G05130 [Hibiscus trionum]
MQSSMEMESLRTLNNILVKTVHAARERAELLNQAYEIIEDELNESMSSGLQNEVLWVCMATQMKEKDAETERVIGVLNSRVNELLGSLENEKKRLSSVCKERDFARKVGCVMKEKIEENERKFAEEIGSLKMECGRFLGEKDALEKEKELLEKNIKDLVDEVGTLRRKIETFEKENKEMEMGENEQRMKIGELEKETRELSRVALNLRKEEGILRSKVLELEKNCGEAMDREAKQAKEICALVEENRAMGMNLERLMEEKDSASKSLESAMAKSEDLQRRIDKFFDERDAARTVMETNTELKDMMKKIVDFLEEFLGAEVTGESEISEIQVVNRFHNSLLEAKNSFNDLRDKMESTIISHGQVLTLLENTASLLCQSKKEKDRNEKEEIRVAKKKLEEEIELIATDLEAIKQAFENKETLAQDLKLKVEVMEKTIAGWQKRINFWKLVSSATTIMSAVTFAHSAKGR